MSTDAQPADSSPAPRPSPDLASLSVEDRDHWRLTGEIRETATEAEPPASPEAESASPADSPPAEPAEQAVSTETTSEAASEPATPKKSNADTRIKELLAERHAERTRREAAERRLAELEARATKPDAPKDSSPSSSFPDFDTWQQANPDGSYDDYLLGKFEHVQTVKQTEAQQRAAAERIEAARSERVGSFLQRFERAVSVNPSLRDRINPAIVALKPVDALQPGEPVTPLNAVAQEILESDAPDKLLVHLSEHPEELDALSKMTPAGVIRRIAKLEAQLDAPAMPPTKVVSSAPAVTTTLGRRPAVGGDPVESAIKTGDFSRYREAANAREIAAMK